MPRLARIGINSVKFTTENIFDKKFAKTLNFGVETGAFNAIKAGETLFAGARDRQLRNWRCKDRINVFNHIGDLLKISLQW